MQEYLNLLRDIYENGSYREDRTGTNTISKFGPQMRFDLTKGFPAITSKKLYLKGVVHELIWLLSGNTNIKYLQDNDVKIWDAWADSNGDLGPVYGSQWRNIQDNKSPAETIDQISNLINSLKSSPNSRRHIVSAWNVAYIDSMALPPCHMMFQYYVRYKDNKRYLDCKLYQRSADMFLGVPFNIASYSLLTHMIAQLVGMEAGEFIHTIGDAHIYSNHMNQVEEQLNNPTYDLCTLKLNKSIINIDDFKFEDIEFIDYVSCPSIRAPVSV